MDDNLWGPRRVPGKFDFGLLGAAGVFVDLDDLALSHLASIGADSAFFDFGHYPILAIPAIPPSLGHPRLAVD